MAETEKTTHADTILKKTYYLHQVCRNGYYSDSIGSSKQCSQGVEELWKVEGWRWGSGRVLIVSLVKPEGGAKGMESNSEDVPLHEVRNNLMAVTHHVPGSMYHITLLSAPLSAALSAALSTALSAALTLHAASRHSQVPTRPAECAQ